MGNSDPLPTFSATTPSVSRGAMVESKLGLDVAYKNAKTASLKIMR